MKNSFISEAGFSLIEFLIVIGLFVFLTGLIVFNLSKAQQHTSIHEVLNSVIADIRNQQLKAMNGDTETRGINDSYGIYFQQNNYILFHGTVYSANDPANYTITLDSGMQFTNIKFPGSSLIFAKGSGEIIGFVNGSNTITVRNNNSNETKTITINEYGVVTGVN